MRTKFIRAEQRFWIYRHSDPSRVVSSDTMKAVAEFPYTMTHNSDFTHEIMLCDTEEEVKQTIEKHKQCVA
jgi:hypothetical protein